MRLTNEQVISNLNSTQTPLGAAGVFVGSWQVMPLQHVGVDCIADQDGTLFIEFGIVTGDIDSKRRKVLDDAVIVTDTQEIDMTANEGQVRTLVNIPGRAFRVRYVNGATEQGMFAIHTAYGDNMFPSSVSEDNEVKTSDRAARASLVDIDTNVQVLGQINTKLEKLAVIETRIDRIVAIMEANVVSLP